MGGQYHIAGLPDPTLEHEAVNLRTLNRKILNEIEVNNLLEAQKYLRLDGQNQMVSDLQMNDRKLVGFAEATAPADGVNKRTLDAAVNSLRSENEQLLLATNENISQRVMFLGGTSLPENNQNYNDKTITNLGEPVEDTDATTKGFIDNQLRKRTFHVTPGAQGHLKMNNHKISGLANPAIWRTGIGANWGHEGNWQRGKGLQLNRPKAWKSACDVGHIIRLTDKMGIFLAVNTINKQRNRKCPSSP